MLGWTHLTKLILLLDNTTPDQVTPLPQVLCPVHSLDSKSHFETIAHRGTEPLREKMPPVKKLSLQFAPFASEVSLAIYWLIATKIMSHVSRAAELPWSTGHEMAGHDMARYGHTRHSCVNRSGRACLL